MRKLVRVDMNQAKIKYEDLAAEYGQTRRITLLTSLIVPRGGAAAMSSSGSGKTIHYCWRSPIGSHMRQLRPSVSGGQKPADGALKRATWAARQQIRPLEYSGNGP